MKELGLTPEQPAAADEEVSADNEDMDDEDQVTDNGESREQEKQADA